MRLDWQPKRRLFTLHDVPDRSALAAEHGLSWSQPSQCLFTDEPYQAVAFRDYATPAAQAQLGPVASEIAASWAMDAPGANWPGYLCPDGLTPYPLQLADLDYIQRRQHTLDGDEMGIGKTPTAIMWGNLLGQGSRQFRGLVICPAMLRLQWADRIRQWSTIPNVSVSALTSSSRGVPQAGGPEDCGVHWTVLSYECARNPGINAAILKSNYDLLVLDESQFLKGPSTGRTRAILGAADRARSIRDTAAHVLALSGTPIPNRPREAYTIASALCPEAIDYMSERAFGNRFNPKKVLRAKGGKVYGQVESTARPHELQARLRACFMTRHLFADAFPQLRLPAYDLVYAEETASVRAALEAEKLLDIDPETFEGADIEILAEVATARKNMGIALAPQVASYCKLLMDGAADKLVVFAWHIEVMDFLQKALDKLGVLRVDGRTTEKAKQNAILQFQNDPGIGVMLGNALTLGTGTDGLQHVCRHAVFAEPDWSPGNIQQCVQRLYRSGQKSTVQADIFVARNSIAERVLATALRKGAVINMALDAKV